MAWQDTYQHWQEADHLDQDIRQDLEKLAEDEKALEDAFYQPLSFGTAGMRGVLGAGINRMNIYTVRQASEGLAQLIESYGDEAVAAGVAIAYDSRHMSPEFAMESARTLGQHGIKSYVFESLRSTPELSFTVRETGSFAGIMITASHNPPEYNGYKVYGADGGQMPPADADRLTEFVRNISDPLAIEVGDQEQLIAADIINIIGEEIDAKYLEALKTVTIDQAVIDKHKDIKIVYTPLHGTGQMMAERALAQAGFEEIIYVDEQKAPDPDFSTVKSPNPEEPGAFEVAEKYGDKYEADILIATDPDADRMGAAVRLPNGEYKVITGNQIGALMTHYILTAHKEAGSLPDNGVILKSIVSGEMAAKIAASFGVDTVNVLTGFKFIAEKIKQYEADGSQSFLFGFEESYGYLIKPFVRDKDAIQALVLLAEVAAYYKDQGQTVYDGLEALYQEYGYFQEKTISVSLPGQEGAAKIKEVMDGLRQEPLTELAGVAIEVTEDYASAKRFKQDGTEEDMAIDQANVLKYYLADGTWVAVRPSGTEPKIKFYIGTVGESLEDAQAKIDQYAEVLAKLMD
ncbi:phosphoglucomutase [Aerococcus urinaehominis]|uniref:Phosphoglucomutase n=1 Tax=Aerococcus urinaehominis TaxID=128944 RepID=A0A0X8FLD1_9LACT|nr:phospho-sugar mutase [Aerococcus urinaehominis]AMB99435.1 phosphoglucomutase [Aerococcus urinaehominis]SDM29121.1 phosphoglucomutase [Aerococcus urinaehominis]